MPVDIRCFHLFSLDYTLDCYKSGVNFKSSEMVTASISVILEQVCQGPWGPCFAILEIMSYFQHSLRRLTNEIFKDYWVSTLT